MTKKSDTAAAAAEKLPAPLALWNKVSGTKAGRLAFSMGYWAKAPYFSTALPAVQSIEPGRAVLTAPKWFGVHNHLGTFHAIAACNLAEAAMGLAIESAIPSTHQWIPKSMNVQYLAKAGTALTATATLPEVDFDTIDEGIGLDVDVPIVDRKGTVVVHAVITIWVRRKRK